MSINPNPGESYLLRAQVAQLTEENRNLRALIEGYRMEIVRGRLAVALANLQHKGPGRTAKFTDEELDALLKYEPKFKAHEESKGRKFIQSRWAMDMLERHYRARGKRGSRAHRDLKTLLNRLTERKKRLPK